MCASAILRFARTSRCAIVRFADQVGAGDLGRAEATERLQRQRHARGHRERRVTAGEDQAQAIVGDRALLGLRAVLLGVESCQLGQARRAVRGRALAPQPVDRLAARGDRDPGTGVGRHAVAWPRRDRGRKGILDRVLGELEVADVADQCGEDRGAFLTERALDGGGRVAVGRRRPPLWGCPAPGRQSSLTRLPGPAPCPPASASCPRSAAPRSIHTSRSAPGPHARAPCRDRGHRAGSSRPAAPWSRRTGRR